MARRQFCVATLCCVQLRHFLCSVTQTVPSHIWTTAMRYMGLLLKSIWKLQLVQNETVQIVLGVPRVAHITLL